MTCDFKTLCGHTDGDFLQGAKMEKAYEVFSLNDMSTFYGPSVHYGSFVDLIVCSHTNYWFKCWQPNAIFE